jgi:hypothetical protein
MTIDSQYFSQSASVMLCDQISLSITVCHEGGASLLIRQELALMTILFARGRKPSCITSKCMYCQCHNCIVLYRRLLTYLHRLLQYKRTPKRNEYVSHKSYETKSFISNPMFFYIHKSNCGPFIRNCTSNIHISNK